MSKKGNSTFVFAVRVYTFKTYSSFQEGNWVWIRTSENVDYTAWGTGQPNDDYSNENCLHMIYDGPELYSWNDYDCSKNTLRDAAMKPLCQKSFA